MTRKRPLRVENRCSICKNEVSSHFFLKCAHPKCITCVDLEAEKGLSKLYECNFCKPHEEVKMKLFDHPPQPDEMLVYAYLDDATQKDIRKYKLQNQSPNEKREDWLKRLFKFEEFLDVSASVIEALTLETT
jgi:hypothetical protein